MLAFAAIPQRFLLFETLRQPAHKRFFYTAFPMQVHLVDRSRVEPTTNNQPITDLKW